MIHVVDKSYIMWYIVRIPKNNNNMWGTILWPELEERRNITSTTDYSQRHATNTSRPAELP